MKRIHLLAIAALVVSTISFTSCKKEATETPEEATTNNNNNNNNSGGPGEASNNTALFDGDTLKFSVVMGNPGAGGANYYSISGFAGSTSMIIYLYGSAAPTADKTYTLVYKSASTLSAGEAYFNIANTPKHPGKAYVSTSGSLQIKMVSGKIQAKFTNCPAAAATDSTTNIKASALVTTI